MNNTLPDRIWTWVKESPDFVNNGVIKERGDADDYHQASVYGQDGNLIATGRVNMRTGEETYRWYTGDGRYETLAFPAKHDSDDPWLEGLCHMMLIFYNGWCVDQGIYEPVVV